MNLKRSDLVTIIIVIAVLFLLGLVVTKQLGRPRAKSGRIHCLSNMKQIGLGFRIWANDCGDSYPMQVSVDLGGAQEAVVTGGVWKAFQIMSNELSVPKTTTCYLDDRVAAGDWQSLFNTNLSYFIGLDAKDTRPNMVLSGDRNLAVDGKPLSGVVALGTNSAVTWTRAIHREAGNIGLADGSVQQVTTEQLRQQLKNSGDATNRLVFPQ
jgi:hypothetical protein